MAQATKLLDKEVRQLAEEVKKLNIQLKNTVGIVTKGQQAFNSNAKSQSKLKQQTTALKNADTNLAKIEKKRIELARLQSSTGQQLIKEQIRLTQAKKKYRLEAEKEMGIVRKSTGFFKGMAKQVVLTGLAYFGVMKVLSSLGKLIKNSIKNADKQLKAEASLLVALKGRKSAQEGLIKQAQELQKVTLFGDEETIKAQALIAAFVKEEAQIKKVIPLVQDLATAKGMDLAGAADLVSKTLGSSTNALSRYGIQVKGAVGSNERLTSLTNGLTKAFGGQAEAAAKAGSGGLKQLKNVLGDVSENIGKRLLPMLNRFANALIEDISPRLKVFEDERNTVQTLISELSNLNTTEERRLEILDSLNSISPKLIENMDAENISSKQIAKNMRAYNNELSKRIILSNLEEEEEKGAAKLVKKRSKLIRLQAEGIALMNQAIRINDKWDKERAKALSNIAYGEGEIIDRLKATSNYLSKGKDTETIFTKIIDDIEKAQGKVDMVGESTLDFTTRIAEMKRLLGLTPEPSEDVPIDDVLISPIGGGLSEEEKKAAKEKIRIERERAEAFKDINEMQILESFDAIDAVTEHQLQATDIVVEAWKKAGEEKKELTEEEIKLYNSAIEDLKATSIDSANEIFDLRSSYRDSEIKNLEMQREAAVASAEEEGRDTEAIKKRFAKKESKLRTNQAIQDKLQALFNAGLDIAEGVINYAKNPITAPLVPVFLALAGVRLGAIAATKIPEFRHGTKNAPGGIATVSEEGSELGITPSGQWFKTPEEETKMFIPKGTQIFPHYSRETKEAIDGTLDYELMNKMIIEQQKTREAIIKQPKKIQNLTHRGLEEFYKHNNVTTKLLTRRFR